ncbi:hypothetical protein M422DRAFT_48131 [Sphaerobolus stellatus SS14]|uniref:Unplaced genomic scaffold SPHSTscaffold_53, whole genome shotgun sequence n=1 Tax=Sphaerobolus stellatus (strain SS14) TaxID=990650 RepID=A0A0C9VVM0_SPHS4|nr:hypothetical protein M422DRAFT_48131 [Sphaerobolus stellatus SS14]
MHQNPKSQDKAQIPPLDCQQAPPAQPQPPAPDPLPNFELQETESQDNDKRCSSHARKGSRYIQDIAEGKGTSQQLPSKPVYPTGVQVPPNKPKDAASTAAFLVMEEIEEEEEIEVEMVEEEVVDWG